MLLGVRCWGPAPAAVLRNCRSRYLVLVDGPGACHTQAGIVCTRRERITPGVAGWSARGMGSAMNANGRISLMVAVVALAAGNSAHAQAAKNGSFGRVTTSGRAAALASRATTAPGTARASLAASRRRSSSSAKALAAYSPQLQGQGTGTSSVPRSSTARQEAPRVAAAPAVATPNQPHNYFPTIRPGQSVQQAVKLTAKSGGMGGMGGGGACMGAGMGAAGGGYR